VIGPVREGKFYLIFRANDWGDRDPYRRGPDGVEIADFNGDSAGQGSSEGLEKL